MFMFVHVKLRRIPDEETSPGQKNKFIFWSFTPVFFSEEIFAIFFILFLSKDGTIRTFVYLT